MQVHQSNKVKRRPPAWLCTGFTPEVAYTKSEARSLFKKQLQEQQVLSFQPQKVTRLPVGTVVIKAA
jgi:hypothetical protein